MELQLAIDLLNKEEAAELAKKVEEYADIVEIGMPIVINGWWYCKRWWLGRRC